MSLKLWDDELAAPVSHQPGSLSARSVAGADQPARRSSRKARPSSAPARRRPSGPSAGPGPALDRLLSDPRRVQTLLRKLRAQKALTVQRPTFQLAVQQAKLGLTAGDADALFDEYAAPTTGCVDLTEFSRLLLARAKGGAPPPSRRASRAEPEQQGPGQGQQQNQLLGMRDAAALQQQLLKRFGSLRNAFDSIDIYGQGHITHAEFRHLLDLLETHIPPARVRAMLAEMDPGQSGTLSFLQFRAFFGTTAGGQPRRVPPGRLRPPRPASGAGRKKPPLSGRSGSSSTPDLRQLYSMAATATRVEHGARRQVYRHWRALHAFFNAVDAQRTGFVPVRDFCVALSKFRIARSKPEADALVAKYDHRHTGRVPYLLFLRHFVLTLREEDAVAADEGRPPVSARPSSAASSGGSSIAGDLWSSTKELMSSAVASSRPSTAAASDRPEQAEPEQQEEDDEPEMPCMWFSSFKRDFPPWDPEHVKVYQQAPQQQYSQVPVPAADGTPRSSRSSRPSTRPSSARSSRESADDDDGSSSRISWGSVLSEARKATPRRRRSVDRAKLKHKLKAIALRLHVPVRASWRELRAALKRAERAAHHAPKGEIPSRAFRTALASQGVTLTEEDFYDVLAWYEGLTVNPHHVKFDDFLRMCLSA